MNKSKIIIWDFDGPIVSSRELALELTKLQFHGVTEDLHRDLFNGNIFSELKKLQKTDITDEEFAKYLDADYWPRKLELEPVPGIVDLISRLSDEFIMVINSSSPTKGISDYLTRHRLNSFFEKVYGKEIPSKEKKFRIILEEFEVTPEDCVLITDTLGDVLEAEKLNIPSIVVLWGYQLRSHFDSVSDRVEFANSVEELSELIEGYFGKSEAVTSQSKC